MNGRGTDGCHKLRPNHLFSAILYLRGRDIRGGSWPLYARREVTNFPNFLCYPFFTSIYVCVVYVLVLSCRLAGISEVACYRGFSFVTGLAVE